MQTHMCSVVFLGGQLTPSMLDERTLFEGRLDPDQVKVGPVAQFSYESSRYRLEINPNRLDVKEPAATSILSPNLVNAARQVATSLEPLRRAIPVTAIGFNCDTVIPTSEIGMTGHDFCSRMVNPKLYQIISVSPTITFVRTRSALDSCTYDVRIEPHHASNGNDLFVAFNAHYENIQSIELDDILSNDDLLRSSIGDIYGRVRSLAVEL